MGTPYENLVAQAMRMDQMFEADDSVFLKASDEDMARTFLQEPGLITEEHLEEAGRLMFVWAQYQSVGFETFGYHYLLAGFIADPSNEG